MYTYEVKYILNSSETTLQTFQYKLIQDVLPEEKYYLTWI